MLISDLLVNLSTAQSLTKLENRLACTSPSGCSTTNNSIDFILIGDTGGRPPPFYTSYAQRKVALAMARVATEYDAKFVLNLGELFFKQSLIEK